VLQHNCAGVSRDNVPLPVASEVYGFAPLQRQRRYAVHLIAIRDAREICLPAQIALQWRMPALTHKRVNDRPVTWHIHYAGVRVGLIVDRATSETSIDVRLGPAHCPSRQTVRRAAALRFLE
jgi:hypothetical protein